jgi:magnesium transporter
MNKPFRPTLIRPFRKRLATEANPWEFHTDPNAAKTAIDFIGCGADQCTQRTVSTVAELQPLVEQHSLCWINVEGLRDEAMIRQIGELFQFHPLAMEDVVHVHQRAKVEEYPGHLFVVLRMVYLNDTLNTEQLSMFIKPGVVVTFQEVPGDCLEPVRKRMADSRSSLRGGNAGQLAHAIIDAIVDAYYPVIEDFGDWIESLEDRIPHERGTPIIEEIHDLRREMLFLKRCVWPLRETLHLLMREQHQQFSADTRLHLRDAYDHSVQLMDVVETYREVCADLRDFYYATVTQRTNEVVKVLTVITTIFMPLSFIAGIYGMNFDTNASPWNMPELRWRYGYPFALAVMAIVGGLLLWFSWRRGWLKWSDPNATAEETEKESNPA